jgi:hypothetical protein
MDGENWTKRLIPQSLFAGRLGYRPLGPSFQFQGFFRGRSWVTRTALTIAYAEKSLYHPTKGENYGLK